jgi:hypothetical protein
LCCNKLCFLNEKSTSAYVISSFSGIKSSLTTTIMKGRPYLWSFLFFFPFPLKPI